jgi:hypothetical protein
LAKTEINSALGRHQSADRIGAALDLSRIIAFITDASTVRDILARLAQAA